MAGRRVCHLIDMNADTSYFRGIAREHDHERFPVVIGSLAPEGPLQEAMKRLEVPTFGLGATGRVQYPAALWRLVRMIRTQGIGAVHAHCFDPTLVGLAAARLAGVPFVFTRHHSDHHIRLGKRWHTRLDAWCARRADRVIAVSEATRRIMRETEGVDREISVVYNGVDLLKPPARSRLEAVARELGLDGEAVCLVPARLHEEKGHRVLLDALPAIRSRVGPVVFLLAGEGGNRAALEADVRRLSLEGCVRFLGQRQDVAELMSLSSVVVLPSLAESFGIALVEAMGLGRPVVSTLTGGVPEVVAHGETGLLVPPLDASALAEAVSQILCNPRLARALGEAGRTRAERFTVSNMMRGYESVYEGIRDDATDAVRT